MEKSPTADTQFREYPKRLIHRSGASKVTPDIASRIAEINKAISENRIDDASKGLAEVCELAPANFDLHLMAGLTAAAQNSFEPAIVWFARAVVIEPGKIEGYHNLGLAHCRTGHFAEAAAVYGKAVAAGLSDAPMLNDYGVALTELGKVVQARGQFEMAIRIDPGYEQAKVNLKELLLREVGGEPRPPISSSAEISGKKIAVFASQKGFITDFVRSLSSCNEVKLIEQTDMRQMHEVMTWCDVAWFEWCDNNLVIATRHMPKLCPIICRLHSYEAFTNQAEAVDWEKVDTLVLVNQSVQELLKGRIPDSVRIEVIPNGVDTSRFTIPAKKFYGKRIASIGYINYKKNPPLLLYAFQKIREWDPEFELHIAGTHQDPRIELYMRDMAEKLHLPIHFQGWIDDTPGFLRDMDFVISTSLFESFHYSIAEGMASGLIPLVHHWFGAENIYPTECLFRTPDECLGLVQKAMKSDRRAMGVASREHIVSNFGLDSQMNSMMRAVGETLQLAKLENKTVDYGVVSIVIPTYNREGMLSAAIESALGQTYPHCEVIVVDDGSADGTAAVVARFGARVTYIKHDTNRGVSAALNTAITHAKGEYISWLSSDDVYHPDKVWEQVKVLAGRPELGWVYSDFYYLSHDSQIGKQAHVHPLENDTFVEMMFQGNPVNGCSVLFRKGVLGKTGMFDESLGGKIGYGADGAMWHKMGFHFPFAFIAKPLVYYRLHPGQVTHQADIPTSRKEYESYMRQYFADQKSAGSVGVVTTVAIEGSRGSRERLGFEVSPDFPEEKPSGRRILWVGPSDPAGNAAIYARAINRHTPHLCRAVAFRNTRGFDCDISLFKGNASGEERETKHLLPSEEERIRDLAERADTIVFSAASDHQMGLPNTRADDTDHLAWGGIDWREYSRRKECVAFFFGATAVRRNSDWYWGRFATDKKWRVATGQIDLKRRWPQAKYVPTWLDIDHPRYQRDILKTDRPLVVQTPTDPSIKNSRELESAVKRLLSQFPQVGLVIKSNLAYSESIALKRKGNIGLDQMQTSDGYYCLGSLENSALGLANFVYLDDYARAFIRETIGTDELPWTIVGSEDQLTMGILRLLQDPDLLQATQQENYDWMRRWWRPELLVPQLLEAIL